MGGKAGSQSVSQAIGAALDQAARATLYQQACLYDSIPPNAVFAVFSAGNPYARLLGDPNASYIVKL